MTITAQLSGASDSEHQLELVVRAKFAFLKQID
jgi:hypothetical protein